MAGLRNLVLSLLRMAGATNIAQALRYWARQGLQCRCCASSVSGSPDPDPLTQGRLLFCAVALSGSSVLIQRLSSRLAHSRLPYPSGRQLFPPLSHLLSNSSAVTHRPWRDRGTLANLPDSAIPPLAGT
jgi:hypothetical protein